MPEPWSEDEVDVLIENLELGYDFHFIALILERTPYAVSSKVAQLVSKERLIVLSTETFDALLWRMNQ